MRVLSGVALLALAIAIGVALAPYVLPVAGVLLIVGVVVGVGAGAIWLLVAAVRGASLTRDRALAVVDRRAPQLLDRVAEGLAITAGVLAAVLFLVLGVAWTVTSWACLRGGAC